jgi:hypothetical protein
MATLFDSTDVSTEHHYFQVIAHTSDPQVFWLSAPDSGYSVDNLAPAQPQGLASDPYYAPDGLTLMWDPNTEPDLSHYRVYRGLLEEFIPGEGNMLGAPSDTTWFDGNWWSYKYYYYKVTAVDIHGNESMWAVLAPDDITGVGLAETPVMNQLFQNYPNPFNPFTRIRFELREPASVSLRVYDPSGRLIRVVADRPYGAGSFTAVWNGKDQAGHEVSSGVYFYRLNAGGFSRTKKMVLVR